MFFCGKCIEIGYQFLTCTGSGKHVDPLILLPGLDRGKLQQIADHLAGVTMQEPGVSRLVAVDVAQAVRLAGVA